MYSCKPLCYLPIQSDRDFVRAEIGDTVLIPERDFERLFGEFLGGVLGVQLEFHCAAATVYTMYATAAPHSEIERTIYLPDWIIQTLEQKQLGVDGLQCNLSKAEPLGRAAVIVARPIASVDETADLRAELEAALYDNHYVHAQTLINVPSGDIWIESVMDADGFEMKMGELGAELALEIMDAPGVAEAQEAARIATDAARVAVQAARVATEAAKRSTEAADIAAIRAARLKYFERKN